MARSIFITGGAGFIGSHITRTHVSGGYDVHLLVRPTTSLWRLADVKHKITLHITRLFDLADMTRLMKRIHPEIIVHLAATGNFASETNSFDMIEANIKGTMTLLEASRDIPYTAFLNTGSSSEYGFRSTPMKETDMLKPTSFYAASKASATYLCSVFAKTYDKPIATIRPFTVYGPWDSPKHFIPTVIRALLADTPIRLTAGTVRHDYIYIDDVVSFYQNAVTYASRIKGQVINMGSGMESSNDEVVKLLLQISGKRARVAKGAYPAHAWDTAHWMADTRKAKQLLQWQPTISLKEGLQKTWVWHHTHTSL